jgi:hypothetical protein
MNYSSWISMLMRSNIPQNMMKTFGYKRKRKRSMTYSLMGVAASAAAAYLFRNQMGGMRQLFQNSNLQSAYQKPAAGITEFAKELTSGITQMNNDPQGQVNTQKSGFHATSSTNPESSQIISQIASTVKQTGNGQQADQLASKLIQANVKKQ